MFDWMPKSLRAKTDPEPEAPEQQGRWTIGRGFEFSYAGRAWSSSEKERHIHGHDGHLQVGLEVDEVPSNSSSNLDWLETFINAHIDHKTILDLEDPWLINIINGAPDFWATDAMVYDADGEEVVVEAGDMHSLVTKMPLNTTDGNRLNALPVIIPGTDHIMGYALDVSELKGPEKEFFEGFLLVEFPPTAEHMVRWFFDGIQAKMDLIGMQTTDVMLSYGSNLHVSYST